MTAQVNKQEHEALVALLQRMKKSGDWDTIIESKRTSLHSQLMRANSQESALLAVVEYQTWSRLFSLLENQLTT